MSPRLLRDCPGCGVMLPAGKRHDHRRRGPRPIDDRRWRAAARAAIAEHRALYGDVCPGWRREAHPTADLTLDHVIPLVRGGALLPGAGGVQILCRSCNSAKGDRP